MSGSLLVGICFFAFVVLSYGAGFIDGWHARTRYDQERRLEE